MQYEYISARLKALQRELDEIAIHNREYFRNKRRSEDAKREHQERQIRALEIKAELASLAAKQTA
jgi:hypothetical protein